MGYIVINNSNVVINNEFTKKRANRLYGMKRWKRSLVIGKFRIYVTWNWRLKTRNKRDVIHGSLKTPKLRKQVYERSGGVCEICKKNISFREMELHHVLPLGKFHFLATNKDNMQCLCHSCHAGLHSNPYKEIAQMEAKAKELGVDLKEYYGV